MTTPQQHELTADELVDEDVIRSYYMQPFMFFVHANIVINLLTWYVDLENDSWDFETHMTRGFNKARLGGLILDLYWMYFFHRYLRRKGHKVPIMSDVTLLFNAVGMALVLMQLTQWLTDLAPTFHYSGFLGFLTFGFGMYYTHFYLPKRVNWKEW